MKEDISLDLLKENVPKKYRSLVDEETVENINTLAKDPDYGEHFKDSILTHTKILDGSEKWSMQQYMDAVKFHSLTAMGYTQVDAYIKVFPERLQSRLDRGQDKTFMNGEASRFNMTDLVNRIRQQSLISPYLYNQGNLQIGIDTLVTIAVNGRSEVARVSAATALLKELRPPETQQVAVQVGLNDDARAAQEKQNAQLLDIAQNQRRLLEAGVSISDVQRIHVSNKEDIIEGEIDED